MVSVCFTVATPTRGVPTGLPIDHELSRTSWSGCRPTSALDYSRGAPFVDWSHLRFDGGAIGARGDTAAIPETTAADEPTADDLRDADAFAVEGDGLIQFVGPTVLFADAGPAEVQYDVTNPGPTAANYTVSLHASTPGLDATARLVVAAGATARLSVPVTGTGLQPGEATVTATLSSEEAGPGLSEAVSTITVPDMSDPAVQADARAALTALRDLPEGSGLDPAVESQVTGAIETAIGGGTEEQLWTATVTITGDRRAAYTSDLAAVDITGDQARPSRISASSSAGERLLHLDVSRVRMTPTLRGTVHFQLAGGEVVRARIAASAWSGPTTTLTGRWAKVGRARTNGTFIITLTAPGTQ